MIKEKIGFIGAGKMATALITGILTSKAAVAENMIIADTDSFKLKRLAKIHQIKSEKSNIALVKKCSIIVLAVKPKDISLVLDEIREAVDEKKLIVSIAAGITEEFIRQKLSWDAQVQIARAMPNAAALALEGATGIYFNGHCSKKSKEHATSIFDSVGISFVFDDESALDAVTALSGSGPAYVFYIIEAMSDAGVAIGLERETSLELAVQTVYGACAMLFATGEHPTILKETVTSPGGTTIKALAVLEKAGVKGSIMEAVGKAYKRAKELAEA